MRYDYLIIGGGMTADAAVRGIRERDASGTIGILAAETYPPYNRPPLTKALWKGDPLDSIWRNTDQRNLTLHSGATATALNPALRTVTDHRGATHEYGALLLATGGTPRTLGGAGDDIIYFRTLDDYQRTRAAADSGQAFVVIGGGFIGAEIAAALRMQQRDVTMIIPGHGIGGRVFPEPLARYIVEYYRKKGVTVRTGESAERVERRGKRSIVTLTGGTSVEADQVIAGLGIAPSVALAQAAGIRVTNGIEVDRQLRTSVPHVYAAGDVAEFLNAALGKRTRVEHEDNANTMGTVAGRNMAGGTENYDHLPFFYSDLFDLGYEAVGDLDARLETVIDWKKEYEEGVVYYLEQGRVRGVLLWNTWGQVDAARALIAEPGPFTPAALKGRLPASA